MPEAGACAVLAHADLGEDLDTLKIDMSDGTTATFREILDDLDADADLAEAINACAITSGGACCIQKSQPIIFDSETAFALQMRPEPKPNAPNRNTFQS